MRKRNVMTGPIAFVVVALMASAGCGGAAQPLKYFSSETGPVKGGHYRAVAVADFNCDGLLDIVAGNFDPGGIEIWLGNGDGSWTQTEGPVNVGNTWSVAAGDFNGDGMPDIVSASRGDVLGVRVWYNRPDGTWVEGPPAVKAGLFDGLITADFNNDGHLDIAATSESALGATGGVIVWLGDGRGNWSEARAPESANIYRDVATADFNGDGILDLVATCWGVNGGVKVWYGDGRGGWFAGKSPDQKGSFWGVATADFNRDGWPDIVAGTYSDGLYLWYGDPSKIWRGPVRLCKQGGFMGVAVGDFNGDGRVDIVSSSMTNLGLRVWLNAGNEGWEERQEGSPSQPNYFGLATGDFNRDGLSDIVAANYSQGVHVWIQTDKTRVIAVPPLVDSLRREAAARVKPPQRREQDKVAARGELGNHVFTWVEMEDGTRFPEYLIGALDQLRVTVYTGLEKKEYDVNVSGAGTIFIPDISRHPIKVEGLAVTQAQQKIVSILSEFLRQPNCEIVVTRYNSKLATAAGEFLDTLEPETGPGRWSLRGMVRILDFINQHGGPTKQGDMSKVQIISKAGDKRVLDLNKAVFEGALEQNVIVDDGDFVFIPSSALIDRKVFVFGEVGRPGVLELQKNITIAEAIARSGGPTLNAHTKGLFVIRGNLAKPEVFYVDFNRLLAHGDLTQNMLLEDNDIVYVPRELIVRGADLFAKVMPYFNIVGAYTDTIVDIETLGQDTWHNVRFPYRRTTVTTGR